MKKKFLAIAMASAVMLTGAGYAAWTDSTVLESTVRTGNFDMQISKASTRTGDNQAQNEAHDWHSYDWTHSGQVWFDANTAVVEFKDLYPGGMVQVDLTQVNKGSIPAKLKSVEVKYLEGNRAVYNNLLAQSSWKADINGDGSQDAWDHVDGWKTWDSLSEEVNQLIASTDQRNLVIEPNGWFALGDGTEDGCIKFKLNPDVGNEFQNQSVKFQIKFNWEQWATDPDANPYDKGVDLPGYGGDGDLQK
ncbi:MAG: hypothetical protein AB7E31_14345 [Desulfitobacterium sp.]